VKPWWIALTAFEREGGLQDVIPEDCQGAVGWFAILADDEAEVSQNLRRDLADVNLRVVEIENVQPVEDAGEVAEADEHLAENMSALDLGKVTVWGTLHLYRADGSGEA